METTGNATRRCVQNQTWSDTDVLKCQSQAIVNVVERVSRTHKHSIHNIYVISPCTVISSLSNLLTQAQKSLPPDNVALDTVTEEQVDAAVRVSGELAVATMRGLVTGLFPRDLNSTNNVVEQVS